jgi:hypothetical protein
MLGHDVTLGVDLFAFDDPRAELVGALSYIALPMIGGAILSWLAIRLWMRISHRPPFNRSSLSISALLGVASYPFAISFYLLWGATGAYYFSDYMTGIPIMLLLGIIFSAPILAITASVFGYYVSNKNKNNLAKDYLIVLIGIFCIPIEYFYLAYLLSA